MISEQGIVERITRNTAFVKVIKTSACNHCNSKDSCNVSEKIRAIEISNSLNANEGDLVEVSIPEGTFITLSLIIYIFPVVALFTGVIVGHCLSAIWHTDTSLTTAITGAFFLIASFLVLKILDRRKNTMEKYLPRMTRIITGDFQSK